MEIFVHPCIPMILPTSNQCGTLFVYPTSCASFHFTPHREWFYKYEKYDSGDVFLGNDRKSRIIGRGKVKLKL